MTKGKMLKAIYSEMASKETVYIEGCQAFSDECGKKGVDGKYICLYCRRRGGQDREEEIPNPVMIGDVLDWVEKKTLENEDFDFVVKSYGCSICGIGYKLHKVLTIWEEKRKPIDSQKLDCILSVYRLIFVNDALCKSGVQE